MKRQINWQEQDLNQLVATHLELSRKRSGTGRKKKGIHNWTQTGKRTYIMALCHKNKGSVEIKQTPTKMGGRTTYRTLSFPR
jgi:hypothetical protein